MTKGALYGAAGGAISSGAYALVAGAVVAGVTGDVGNSLATFGTVVGGFAAGGALLGAGAGYFLATNLG